MKKNIPLILAILILIGAALYGNYIDKMDAEVVEEYFKEAIPMASNFEFITDNTAKVFDENGQLTGYVGVSSDVGYGGPLFAVTDIDLEGNIKNVILVEHKETPAFIDRIIRNGYFDQYDNKTISDSLLPLYDIDCVSGATLSTRAIGNSVREIAHSIADTELGIKPEKAKLDWQVGIAEIAITLVFIAGLLLSRYQKLRKYRLVLLLASIVILGFWLNRSLTIANISALFLGYFPAPQTNLIWYLVLFGAIVPALFTGKNIYCTYICPFCGLQEYASLLSKTNLSVGKFNKLFNIVRDITLFIVIFIAFISLNPSKASYEPFGTIFGMNGTKFGWYLVFVSLVISFFYRRFWCKTFCPVGATLDKIAMLGRYLRKKLRLRTKRTKVVSSKDVETVKTKEGVKAEMTVNNKINDTEKQVNGYVKTKKLNVSFLLIISYIALAISVIVVLKSNLI